MGGVKDSLIQSAEAGDAAHDIARDIAADAALDMRVETDRKLNGKESSGLAGAIDGLIKIAETGLSEEALGCVVLNPSSSPQSGIGIALEIALLDGLGVANYLPAVTGEIGSVDDEDADGSSARGLLVLVGPAAIVGEGLTLEESFVVGGRFVDNDESDLAVEIEIRAVGKRVVVPVVLGRVDAVSDKDNRSVEIGVGLAGLILGDNLSAVGEIDGPSGLSHHGRRELGWHEGEVGLVFNGVDGHKRNSLEVSAVVACGLDAGESKLRGDVFGGQLCTTLAGTAALKQVEREEADVSADLRWINGGSGGACSRGKAVDFRNSGGGLLSAGASRGQEESGQSDEKLQDEGLRARHGDSVSSLKGIQLCVQRRNGNGTTDFQGMGTTAYGASAVRGAAPERRCARMSTLRARPVSGRPAASASGTQRRVVEGTVSASTSPSRTVRIRT